ncbi:MAG: epoxide hydrolase N-terminal domain-containing protein [candidate division NC10 bacterium]
MHGYEMLNGVRLHFVRQGEGPPILLIHGWPGFWYE